MKKRIVLLSMVAFAIFSMSSTFVKKENGRAGNVGSPGENTCNASFCHNSFPTNSGPGSISIQTDVPSNQYQLNTSYTITVTVRQPSIGLFGFACEILTPSNTNAGTMTITDAVRTQTLVAVSNSRRSATHRLDGGLSPDSAVFTFDWTSPATNIGNITLYAAGNAANDDGDELLDYVYTANQILTPAPGLSVEEDGVLNSFRIIAGGENTPTTIKFDLLKESSFAFAIHSLDGKMFYSIPAQNKEIGEHSILVPSSNMNSGIYIATITINNKSYTQKFFKY